jgi:hypothetical protein
MTRGILCYCSDSLSDIGMNQSAQDLRFWSSIIWLCSSWTAQFGYSEDLTKGNNEAGPHLPSNAHALLNCQIRLRYLTVLRAKKICFITHVTRRIIQR